MRSAQCFTQKVESEMKMFLSSRLTESHRKAIRVIQRMRYFVAKRNFQVIPVSASARAAWRRLTPRALKDRMNLSATVGRKE